MNITIMSAEDLVEYFTPSNDTEKLLHDNLCELLDDKQRLQDELDELEEEYQLFKETISKALNDAK